MPKIEELKALINKVKANKNFWPVLISAAVILMVVIATILVLLPKANFNKVPLRTNVSTQPAPTPYVQSVWTVMVTKGVAVPKVVTMKKGGTLNFLNVTQGTMDIESSDASSPNTLLDLGSIPFGSVKSVVMPATGTYQYVNKLNDKVKGTVIVE
jgi:hypothetical protein